MSETATLESCICYVHLQKFLHMEQRTENRYDFVDVVLASHVGVAEDECRTRFLTEH